LAKPIKRIARRAGSVGRYYETGVNVRLSETDALGVVYYAQYFVYFDIARQEMLRSSGLTLKKLREKGLSFVAGEASCRYLRPLGFDDRLRLRVWVSRIGSSSVTYRHVIMRGREKAAEGRVTDVLVDSQGRPASLPDDIRRVLSRFLL
jgi:acyl-CoA thioester hydrolase